MRFIHQQLDGLVLVELDFHADERGFFARTWCAEEFGRAGLNAHLAQCSISYNHRRGTLRGMHYQLPPHAECKLVRCTRGAVFDVAVDLRADSPTRYRWVGHELTADNRRMLYIPEGFAHGFLTLADDTEVSYQISERYHPECSAGVRWDDPALAIAWPFPPTVISARDAAWPAVRG